MVLGKIFTRRDVGKFTSRIGYDAVSRPTIVARDLAAAPAFSNTVLWLVPLCVCVMAAFLCFGGEDAVAAYFTRSRSAYPAVAALASWLSDYGNIPFYFLLILAAYDIQKREEGGGIRFVVCYFFCLVLLLLVVDTLKIWIGRPRPGEFGECLWLSLRGARHSFPSNHVAETAFSVLTLAHLSGRKSLSCLCGLWLAVMGATRVYLGRHHPTDLLGSAVVGVAAVYFLYWVVARLSAEASAAAPAASRTSRSMTAFDGDSILE